jgi:hypothetical protein
MNEAITVTGQVPNELPSPEPPPAGKEEINWTTDIINAISDNEEMVCKPTSAQIIFEQQQPVSNLASHIHSCTDKIPLTFCDPDKTTLDMRMLDDSFGTIDDDTSMFGKILTGSEMEGQNLINDPILNVFKQQGTFVPGKWQPNLNTVIEEQVYDIDNINGVSCLKSKTITSGKKQRSWTNNLQKQKDHSKANICKAITKNGLYRIQIQSAQNDGGANRLVTASKDLLIHYEDIEDYAIGGVKEGEPAIICTGKGYIPWRANSGEIILIRSLYCPHASGTILSPSDINAQYLDRYDGWSMVTNYDSKIGIFKLMARDSVNHLEFSAYSENNLWFHYLDQVTASEYERIGKEASAVVRTLTNGAAYELWHNRLGHPGETIMSRIHEHVIGVPKLKKNKFYSCAACMSAKFKKVHIGPTKTMTKTATDKTESEPGQHLHLDFGFVCGSDWAKKDNDGKLVTSMDGFRSYCLIIDRATRYIWIVLTKRKTPPITELRGLFTQLASKVKNAYRTVTTNLGGELAKSKAFRNLLMEPEITYSLKTTGAHSSAQNGLAEKPNQDLARMMRLMLYGAGLGSQYWAYAICHAVYLKNRLPHTSLNYTTPYEKLNGVKPDLSKLRVFGARAHYMNKTRAKKLDKMDSVGTFMTFKGTDKISYVIDNVTGCERIATHISFDEAHASVPAAKQPPMATALIQSGYREVAEDVPCTLKVKLLDTTALAPVRGSIEAAGLDVHSFDTITIQPNDQAKISTKIAMEPPPGYHGQLFVRSSYASKYKA